MRTGERAGERAGERVRDGSCINRMLVGGISAISGQARPRMLLPRPPSILDDAHPAWASIDAHVADIVRYTQFVGI